MRLNKSDNSSMHSMTLCVERDLYAHYEPVFDKIGLSAHQKPQVQRRRLCAYHLILHEEKGICANQEPSLGKEVYVLFMRLMQGVIVVFPVHTHLHAKVLYVHIISICMSTK